MPQRQDHDHQARRTDSLALRGPEEVRRFHPWVAAMHLLPRRPGRQGLAALHSTGEGQLRLVPRRRGATVCKIVARQGGRSWRCSGAALRELPRQSRHPAGEDPRSSVAAMKVPFLCGQCHREGTPVQTSRNIPEHDILENYSESIHGEALLKKGLIVAANCASCHTAHSILPHTDPNSSIARRNIAATCTKCHD